MNIIEIFNKYPTKQDCLNQLESIRWPNGTECPYCNSRHSTLMTKEYRYHCNSCNTSFSVTVNTIFHNTKLPLQKWFLAVSLVLNAKKGIAARQLARDIKVTKDTAWRMEMQIRKAMKEYGYILKGIIEADECYIGGKNKNRHNDKKIDGCQGRSGKDKTPIIGAAERNGNVIAKKVEKTDSKTLKAFITEKVEKGATVMTDEWLAYNVIDKDYDHKVINHKLGEYVNGDVYTNTIEGFWSLFKRGYIGQYHQLKEKYLDKYLDEFCYRYNNRKNDNDNVFIEVLTRGM